MKVLILSTYATTGGAAIAANRLMHALNSNGVEATMLCRKHITWGPARLRKQSWASIWERVVIWAGNGFSTKNLWAMDIANCGEDVTRTEAFKEADVIHLHWVNQGFLSLDTIRKIVQSGKRVVWTMHDEWPLDSVWHYTEGTMPASPLADKVLAEKQKIYSEGRITFVTCSRWLCDIARKKPLGMTQEVVSVPNPIDMTVFHPMDKAVTRTELGLPKDERLILYACQKVTDIRKGVAYLIDAMAEVDGVGVVLVGGNTDDVKALMPQNVKVYSLGAIRDVDKMAKIYAAVDAFVTPSLQDNLPNTIMESMSSGTPCVGFNVGGIPEMIDDKVNGYVSEYKNAHDLAAGIRYVLDPSRRETLSRACLEKVRTCYGETAVAEKYIEVYKS